MFEREMMIAGLKKQQGLLAGLIEEIERKPELNPADWNLCGDRTKAIARNLQKLRRIKSSYFSFQCADDAESDRN